MYTAILIALILCKRYSPTLFARLVRILQIHHSIRQVSNNVASVASNSANVVSRGVAVH